METATRHRSLSPAKKQPTTTPEPLLRELPALTARLTHLTEFTHPARRLMSLVLRIAVAFDKDPSDAVLDSVENSPFLLGATWRTQDGVFFGLRCYPDGRGSVMTLMAGTSGESHDPSLATPTAYRDRLKSLVDQQIAESADYSAAWG